MDHVSLKLKAKRISLIPDIWLLDRYSILTVTDDSPINSFTSTFCQIFTRSPTRAKSAREHCYSTFNLLYEIYHLGRGQNITFSLRGSAGSYILIPLELTPIERKSYITCLLYFTSDGISIMEIKCMFVSPLHQRFEKHLVLLMRWKEWEFTLPQLELQNKHSLKR